MKKAANVLVAVCVVAVSIAPRTTIAEEINGQACRSVTIRRGGTFTVNGQSGLRLRGHIAEDVTFDDIDGQSWVDMSELVVDGIVTIRRINGQSEVAVGQATHVVVIDIDGQSGVVVRRGVSVSAPEHTNGQGEVREGAGLRRYPARNRVRCGD